VHKYVLGSHSERQGAGVDYEKPTIADYGDLVQMTAEVNTGGFDYATYK
jgi:hypothetical protein